MRSLRLAAVLAAAAAAPLGGAAAQPTVITFDAVPTATAAGAFATASGYTFTNFSTLETGSSFGAGSNGQGARFAYVPLGLGFGSVRRESLDFYLQSALLSYRAFDANVTGPVTVTLNGYRGFDLGSDPVFTRTLTLTNTAQLFDFGGVALSEFEFITTGAELGGRRSVVAMDNLTLASVPEPATVVLFGAGAVVLAAAGRARRGTA